MNHRSETSWLSGNIASVEFILRPRKFTCQKYRHQYNYHPLLTVSVTDNVTFSRRIDMLPFIAVR